MVSKLLKNFNQLFFIAFCSIVFQFIGFNKATKAQISPDGSLPTDVNQSDGTAEITGGEQAGNNLFHSFKEFSVPNGQEAFFNNAADINNIISRVTGNSISKIDGLIRANGSANIFLLNSNGIVFGPNASLDIGGSFLGTTVESLIFEDGKIFDTKNSQAPLLSVNIPIGLQIGSEPGSIVNRSVAVNDTGEVVGLEVNPSQNLTLIGGEINLEGGYITAPGGQVNLGGLSAPGRVSFTNNLLNFGDRNSLANVSLSNGAEVNVRSDDIGGISIDAKNLSLIGVSGLLAGIKEELGSAESKAGDIDIKVAETATIAEGSFISNSLKERSIGEGGDVNIEASSLFVTNNSTTYDTEIASVTQGRGNAGNITIKATNFISVTNESTTKESVIQTETFSLGDAGDINIESESANVSFKGVNTRVTSSVIEEATGKGGNISIKARSLTMTTAGDSSNVGAKLEASTSGQGDAGNIFIQADEIVFDGAVSGAFSAVGETGIGQGGDIDIQTRSLSIMNGASIFTSTRGRGDAGNINITASDSLTVSGTAPFPTLADGTEGGFSSLLYTASDDTETNEAMGQGGDIRIDTNNLQLSDGAAISGRSRSNFRGGNITVNAGTLEIVGGAQILTTAFDRGSAGDIILNVSDKIDISGSDPSFLNRFNSVADRFGRVRAEFRIDTNNDASGIYANTRPDSSGDSGSISINSEQLNLSNNAQISVATEGNGDGGNIFLQTQDLLTLRNNSRISATAEGETRSNGGNVTIDTDFVIASPNENSDIVTRAFEGDGGDININADSLFGIEERIATEGNITNDIDASSEFGLSGTVEINTPDVDRDRDLVQLPTQPTAKKVVPACTPSEDGEQSEFVIKGRGGLPPSPESALDSDTTEVDWVTRPPQNQNSSKITNSISKEPASIVEAQGWMVDDRNEIVLVADNSPNQSWRNSPQCQKQAKRRNSQQNHSSFANNLNQNILIASAKPNSSLAKVPERITVDRFEVEGNRAVDSDELTEVLAPYTNKSLSFTELLQARSAITEYYTERGYITSGAYIPLQKLQNKTVKIQVVEGYLEDIQITGNKRLNSDYFSDRIETASDSLQREELLSALQLLQQDPLITSISAELEAGTRPGASVLAVDVKEADSFKTPISLDNRRTPSVGSFRRQLAIDEGNLLGFGDNLFLAYSNTEGSDAFDGSYAVPFNARNGTLTVSGGLSSSEVVEEPFNQLNILGDSHYYELSLRQPVIQTPTQEFALGITASRRNSDISSLLEQFDVPPSELSPGADESGQTRVSALRFFQEWTSRNNNEVIAARSQFNLGLDVFDATVNESAPDSRFLAWQGQAQWARQLAPDTSFLLRGGIQLATTSLLSSEQFGLGGLETLRGYRQDLLLTDNAAFASAEIRLPIFRIDQIDSVFQLAPFFDVGTAWNNGEERNPETNTLASIGMGLRLLFNSFTARLDWGIPLVSVDSDKKTWQENGLYFSVEYDPF